AGSGLLTALIELGVREATFKVGEEYYTLSITDVTEAVAFYEALVDLIKEEGTEINYTAVIKLDGYVEFTDEFILDISLKEELRVQLAKEEFNRLVSGYSKETDKVSINYVDNKLTVVMNTSNPEDLAGSGLLTALIELGVREATFVVGEE